MSGSVDDSDDCVISRHRKEKKELQSKIQFLKKGASKGDKKKRKEILDEITKIEYELTKRHAEELNDINNIKNANESLSKQLSNSKTNQIEMFENAIGRNYSNNESESFEFAASNCYDGRISKAQKRRDKKDKKEKEKQAEIAAQEELLRNGPRTLELQAIKDILKKRCLKLYLIPSDGDCLYNAICHQMSLITLTLNIWENFIHQKEKIKYLRNETANYIEKHKESLIFYMTNQNTGDVMSNEEFEIYCNQIRNTSSWGGQIEIRAIANILKVRIEVLQASGPPTVQEHEQSEDVGPTLVITYHRHMYSLGEHYNSTISVYDEIELEEHVHNDDDI